MKLASSGELIVWAVVAIIVGISKAIGKLSKPEGETSEPAPAPIPQPRARPNRPRSLPPVMRPSRPVRTAESARDFRSLLDQITRPRAATRIAPPPPVVAAIPVQPVSKPIPATPPAVLASQVSRSPWTAALRDRSNLRNMIIVTEILGPPRGA